MLTVKRFPSRFPVRPVVAHTPYGTMNKQGPTTPDELVRSVSEASTDLKFLLSRLENICTNEFDKI
jgi:hypothetical protein